MSPNPEPQRRLRRHRLDRELSQQQLAERAGLSKRSLERLENSANGAVNLQHLVNVACALGCSSVLDVIDDEWLEYTQLVVGSPPPERARLERSAGDPLPNPLYDRVRRSKQQES